MDLASVVAALASVGVRVSGSAPNSSVQVDSSGACPPGLAGPEPSGTIHDLGQHFQHSRVLEQELRHRVYTRDLKGACERVAKGCKQCQATIPKNQKAEGLLKGLPIPERLFDKVTADVFELGQIQEECLYTRKPIDGVLLIQDRHSGYIQVLPCNTKHLTSEMAAKWTASQW